MTGASIETTLELWASSLRDVKGRMRGLFTQERVEGINSAARPRYRLQGIHVQKGRSNAGAKTILFSLAG